MNGREHPGVVQFAGYLAILFAHFLRHSYTGCKPAISEVLASQAALVAEYNGVEKAEHVKEKDLPYHRHGRTGLCGRTGQRLPGREIPVRSYVPDEDSDQCGTASGREGDLQRISILAESGRRPVATLPLEEEFFAEETAALVNKYIKRNPAISSEDTHRCFRMVENQLCSHFAGATMIAGLHGGGSPQMETIAMMGAYGPGKA